MVVNKILTTIALLFIMPLLTGKLGLHEGLVLGVTACTVAVGKFISGFVKNLWPGFYLSTWSTFMLFCQFGAGRALLTKTVDPEEIGKVKSILRRILPDFIVTRKNLTFRFCLLML